MPAHSQHHVGPRTRQHDRHLIAKPEALGQFNRSVDRRLEPSWFNIGRLHTGRIIDHQNNAFGL